MNNNNPIRSIAIVGGGTAGWSAAACMTRFLQNRDVKITVIDSHKVPTVGVGEASIPNLRNFNAYIGLQELDFVQSCAGTFKLGIRFDDWRDINTSFFHPFGDYGVDFEGVSFNQCFLNYQQTNSNAKLEDYSLSIALAKENRFAQPQINNKSPLSHFGYAYHFDAGLYAKRLRQLSLERNVQHRDAFVVGASLNAETGLIDALRLDDGSALSADLYIDCSGFRALLIEGALKTGYHNWQRWLPCDRAVAIPTEHSSSDMPPYTVASAQSAGWRWEIPLQHRTGNGYVYCGDVLSETEACDELIASLDGGLIAEPNHQRFTAGMRKKFWNRNCVALGLAGGFIEPLESTSINLVHRALSVLMDFFPDRNFDPRLLDTANSLIASEQERIRDFIILHYKLNQRSDSEFWKGVREAAVPDSLLQKMQAYESNGYVLEYQHESFETSSWISIYNGFGIVPDTLDTRIQDINQTEMNSAIGSIKQSIESSARTAMKHSEFIGRFCSATVLEKKPNEV